VTEYEILAKCGKEDLTIYLGYTNKEVEEIRSKLFDPSALAHKVSYDKEKGWGKGFIWLRGIENLTFLWDKNSLLNLKGIFVHELGHVLGNDHRDGTIMTSTFSDYLYEDEISEGGVFWDFYKFYMTNIDWSEELVQCLTCNLIHENGILWLPGSRAERETFKFLTNDSLKGIAISKMVIDKISEDQIDGTYTVSDSERSKSYPITFLINSLNFTFGSSAIFKRALTWSFDQDSTTIKLGSVKSSDFTIFSFTGWMEKDGKSIPIIFEGKSSPLENFTKYPEDEDEDAYVEKTYPYRLIALDGKERYILFTKLQVTKLDGDEDHKFEFMFKKVIK